MFCNVSAPLAMLIESDALKTNSNMLKLIKVSTIDETEKVCLELLAEPGALA